MGRIIAMGVLAIAVVLVALAVVRSGDDTTVSTAAEQSSTSTSSIATLAEPPPMLGQALELTGLDGWLQSDVELIAEVEDPVKIVQFWTFGCINCKRTLDNLGALYDTYDDAGLEIIGVHAPEFDYEADVDNIIEAAENLEVRWPIALDTNKTNFRLWQTERRFWPRTYVVDANNEIRFDHIGEGAYDELWATVSYLLDNDGV